MKYSKVKVFVLILFCTASTTLRAQTVKDIDGNSYHTTTIGKQVWMVENLKVIHYRNGVEIPNVGDHMKWSFLETGAYCDYDNSPLSNDVYGRLYNFYTIENKKLCPDGWHVPSDDEWTALSTYLGKNDSIGAKLKATGTYYWSGTNSEATNESGFTALPGGNRASNGAFAYIGGCGYWWSSTHFNKEDGWGRYLFWNTNKLYRSNSSVGSAFSVRCLKN
jgi:uncharacterized protein (TIGR02145 family)